MKLKDQNQRKMKMVIKYSIIYGYSNHIDKMIAQKAQKYRFII